MIMRVVIAEHERGFVHKDGVFARFLMPGSHWIVSPFAKTTIRRASVLEPKLTFPDVELIAANPRVAPHVMSVRIADHERGLIFREGNFAGFLGPGFHAFLRGPAEARVEIVDARGLTVEHPMKGVLVRAAGSAAWIKLVEVADGMRGVLYVDNKVDRELTPGRHFFWTGLQEITAFVVDMREQTLEVQGQELMTQDKVTLRLNVTVRFRVADLVKAVGGQTSFREAFYRDLQLALRDEVGARTLDALLADKDTVRNAVVAKVKPAAEQMGLVLLDAGIRDVILPGEMRTIFNQVIEAEKRAQANMISRREETAATRNLMNTAKLLENNPVLMRLKELEATERIAEKIGTLQVVGGLEGLMKALGQNLRP